MVYSRISVSFSSLPPEKLKVYKDLAESDHRRYDSTRRDILSLLESRGLPTVSGSRGQRWYWRCLKCVASDVTLFCSTPSCRFAMHMRCANLAGRPTTPWFCPICVHNRSVTQ